MTTKTVIEEFDEEGVLRRRTVTETDNDVTHEQFPWTTTGTDTSQQWDRTRNCPCRAENGGSGVCNCILGGPQVWCLTGSVPLC